MLSISIGWHRQCDTVVFPNNVLLAPVICFLQHVSQLRVWWHAEDAFGCDVRLQQHEAGRLSQDPRKARSATGARGEGLAGSECAAATSVRHEYVVGYAAVGEVGRGRYDEVLDVDVLGEGGQAGGCDG